jgi:ribose 1,5-bisphosphokinase PhnN
VQSKQANESRCEVALELNLHNEPLVNAPQLLERGYENEVSTRDRLARTGADARIEESGAMGEVCLAIRPYGRYSSVRSGAMS